MRLTSRSFPPSVDTELRATLEDEHARRPFTPTAVRDAARRVGKVVDDLGLDATTYRGGLDVGGAELDHVWAVIDQRVVDVAFPLFADDFLSTVRAYVLGEIDGDELDRAAGPYPVRCRILGDYPQTCRYTGRPVWSETHQRAGAR